MLKRGIYLILLFAFLSYASCILDKKKYDSIEWMDECSSFKFNGNFLVMSERKLVPQDIQSFPVKGIMCFSKDKKYARVSHIIQCKGCFPTEGYSFFALHLDTLKNCTYVRKKD